MSNGPLEPQLWQVLEARDRLIASLRSELEEKERVIQDLNVVLSDYHALSVIKGLPLRLLLRVLGAARRRLRPTFGQLNQHPPIPLQLPKPRQHALRIPPRISIVTPSFNQGAFIERTLRSVLDQGYPDLEYVVQDGGSNDQTADVLRRYDSRLAGWRSEPDKGQAHAINLGFSRTTGEIMAWLNSDDILLPGALNAVAHHFETHPEVDVVYGNRILIDKNDQQVGRWILPGHSDGVLSWADYVPQESLFWRRRVWERVGGHVDESFRFAMDWDLLVRFRDAGARFGHIPRFIGAFRVHSGQKTQAIVLGVGQEEMDRIRRRVLGHQPSGESIRRALLPYRARQAATELGWRIRNKIGMTS